MAHYEDILNRLKDYINSKPDEPIGNIYHRTISEMILSYDGELPINNALTYYTVTFKTAPRTLAAMPRWLTLPHYRQAAEGLNSIGAVFRAADMLRWIALDETCPRAAYYNSLASKLDEKPEPVPVVLPPTTELEFFWRVLLEALAIFDEKPNAWSDQAARNLFNSCKNCLDELTHGVFTGYVNMEFPEDFPPPVDEDGSRLSGIVMSSHHAFVMTLNNSDSVTEAEKEQNKLALEYYPDEAVAAEITLPDGVTYCLSNLSVETGGVPETDLTIPVGSFHIDHTGEMHKFSPSDNKYAFKVYLPSQDLDEDESIGTCFLVSERVTYSAFLIPD